MDYIGILKKAFEICLKKKYLWIFGILAGGTATSWNFSLPSSDFSDRISKYRPSDMPINSFEQFWQQYWGVIIFLAGLIFLLGLIWLIFSIISQGALLGEVRSIEKDEAHNFRLGLAFGWHKFWKTFSVGLLLTLLVIISIVILALPVILLILAKIYIAAAIYGFFIFLLDLAFWIYIGLMSPYILRMAVLDNKGVLQSFVSSWDFLKKFLKDILVIYLLMIAVGIVFGLAMLFVILLIGGLLAAIGFAIYLASHFVFWIYVGIFGAIFLALLIICGGFFNCFNSTVFTLFYLKLNQKS